MWVHEDCTIFLALFEKKELLRVPIYKERIVNLGGHTLKKEKKKPFWYNYSHDVLHTSILIWALHSRKFFWTLKGFNSNRLG